MSAQYLRSPRECAPGSPGAHGWRCCHDDAFQWELLWSPRTREAADRRGRLECPAQDGRVRGANSAVRRYMAARNGSGSRCGCGTHRCDDATPSASPKSDHTAEAADRPGTARSSAGDGRDPATTSAADQNRPARYGSGNRYDCGTHRWDDATPSASPRSGRTAGSAARGRHATGCGDGSWCGRYGNADPTRSAHQCGHDSWCDRYGNAATADRNGCGSRPRRGSCTAGLRWGRSHSAPQYRVAL